MGGCGHGPGEKGTKMGAVGGPLGRGMVIEGCLLGYYWYGGQRLAGEAWF